MEKFSKLLVEILFWTFEKDGWNVGIEIEIEFLLFNRLFVNIDYPEAHFRVEDVALPEKTFELVSNYFGQTVERKKLILP